MQRTIVAVCDASRARLFTFERLDDVEGARESFIEHADLVNPARRRTPAQLFSDTRTNTSVVGGRHYGVDDHRDAHMDAIDAEFARTISVAVTQALRDTGATHVIVCASPRMLGTLRTTLRLDGIAVDELARDYAKMTSPQIHEQLVDHGMLPVPPRRRGLAS